MRNGLSFVIFVCNGKNDMRNACPNAYLAIAERKCFGFFLKICISVFVFVKKIIIPFFQFFV